MSWQHSHSNELVHTELVAIASNGWFWVWVQYGFWHVTVPNPAQLQLVCWKIIQQWTTQSGFQKLWTCFEKSRWQFQKPALVHGRTWTDTGLLFHSTHPNRPSTPGRDMGSHRTNGWFSQLEIQLPKSSCTNTKRDHSVKPGSICCHLPDHTLQQEVLACRSPVQQACVCISSSPSTCEWESPACSTWHQQDGLKPCPSKLIFNKLAHLQALVVHVMFILLQPSPS